MTGAAVNTEISLSAFCSAYFLAAVSTVFQANKYFPPQISERGSFMNICQILHHVNYFKALCENKPAFFSRLPTNGLYTTKATFKSTITSFYSPYFGPQTFKKVKIVSAGTCFGLL